MQEYGAITGNPTFCKLAREMAFGAAHPAVAEKRVATVQALSGAVPPSPLTHEHTRRTCTPPGSRRVTQLLRQGERSSQEAAGSPGAVRRGCGDGHGGGAWRGRVVYAGTGSLRVGAELLAIHYPVKKVLVAAPTWPTHKTIFARAGLQVRWCGRVWGVNAGKGAGAGPQPHVATARERPVQWVGGRRRQAGAVVVARPCLIRWWW